MINLKNYYKTTSVKVKKVGLWLKGLIGTAAGSAFIQNDAKLAFYLLLGGALVTGILELLPPDDNTPNQTGSKINGTIAAIVLGVLAMGLVSCRVIKPAVNTTLKDSTTITQTPFKINVKGAKVFAGLNIDSLIIAGRAARAQYVADSTAAAKAGKPIPAAPKPQTKYITDPDTKAQLSYWLDQYGKLQVGCESKDQVVTALNTEINRLKTQVTTKTEIVNKTPVWNWIAIAVLGTLLVISVLLNVFKKS